MNTPNPLAMVSAGRSVLDPATWLEWPGSPRAYEPSSAPSVVGLLRPLAPDVDAAAGAYAVALAAHTAAADAGAELVESHSSAQASYSIAARTGDLKAKRPDEDAVVAQLLALWRTYSEASTATRHASRSLDECVTPNQADTSSTRATAYAVAMTTAASARVAVAEAEESAASARAAFETVMILDAISLRAAGVAADRVGQILDDRFRNTPVGHRFDTGRPRPLGEMIPLGVHLEILARPASEQHAASERATRDAIAARARRLDIVAVGP